MTVSAVLDAAGRRRSPATMPGYHAGRTPRNKGQLDPADPPTVEEIVAVMREARRRPPWLAAARPDCRSLARRAARPRGAHARRTRPRQLARLAARAQRQGRPAPRHRLTLRTRAFTERLQPHPGQIRPDVDRDSRPCPRRAEPGEYPRVWPREVVQQPHAGVYEQRARHRPPLGTCLCPAVHLRAPQHRQHVAGIEHRVALAPGARDGHQMVVADEDAQIRSAREPLPDPRVVLATDLAVVDFRLGMR
jgi:hypothetical protein